MAEDGKARISGIEDSEQVKDIWTRCWFLLNEVLAHAVLLATIVVMIFLLQTINHWIDPPDGLMLWEDAKLGRKLPLEWGFTLADLTIIGRFVWLSTSIFRK